jgi:hypothetical protein
MTEIEDKKKAIRKTLIEPVQSGRISNREEITEKTVIKRLFPNFTRKNKERKTIIDKAKIDFGFIVKSIKM